MCKNIPIFIYNEIPLNGNITLFKRGGQGGNR
jgi:hypothetical protein